MYSQRVILKIDLSDRTFEKEDTVPYIDLFIGGRGIGSKLLYDNLNPNVDPLGPENILVFNTGPLSGTAAPASGRVDVSGKSPMNNYHAVSNFGGFWGAEFSQAGYNHLVIAGSTDTPVYLYIDNDRVEFRDARHLWGMSTYDTIKTLREELKDPDIQALCIGPGGENLVRYASIQTSLGDAAGRMGMGAVMGSKKLKAIAVRGTKGISLYDSKRFMETALQTHRFLRESDVFENFKTSKVIGDPMFSKKAEDSLSFGNYEAGSWDRFGRLNPETFFLKYQLRRTGCFGCPLQCMHLIQLPEGEFGVSRCMNFQSFLGTVWNDDLITMWDAIVLANKYGLDSHETGGMIALLMELYKDGVISAEDSDGIPMEKGSRKAILQIIHKIARREGIGDILAEGPQRAAEAIGGVAPDYVVAAKGLFPHGYQFQAIEGTSLMQAVSSGEPFQTYGTGIERTMDPDNPNPRLLAQAKELYGSEKAYLQGNYSPAKVKMIIDSEHRSRVPDLMGVCLTSIVYVLKTVSDIHFLYDRLAELYNSATGRFITREELFKTAERLVTLERCIDAREGLTRDDDTLPRRFFRAFETGKNRGKALNEKKMEEMKTTYYRLRGWDTASGLPTAETLTTLELGDIVEKNGIQKRNRLRKTG
ncbi:MAG: aldehyde ferredoxin oxidoreductase family protein [Deltaproteobacteria bacterium]|nr:aldehyde ferredoxin oxidoreductase family protein [Deltaproteobacteria bacterium]MBW2150556.1 aldehyde ferredoxin oxidoreductase family protein [Deltaproteobacteria bacterium]